MKISKDELEKKYKLIPINNIKISYDENKTVGYDFTVEDNYTFSTYDGIFVQDTMAVYIPISDITTEEVKDKILASKNLSSPANNYLVTKPSQDIILGIYALTNNLFKTEDMLKIVEYKNKNITKSRKIFNECLPDDYPIIDYSLTGKKLLDILENIKNNYEESITVKVLDNIKLVGFKYSTLFGPTLDLESMHIEEADELVDNIYEKSNSIYEMITKISSSEIQNILKEKFKQSYFVESGSRGSWQQLNQLILTRGFISNFKGEILKTPIKNNLLKGLTPKEFFLSTYGCRKGLLDTALNTSKSGYLSRKLVFSCANLKLNNDLEDCGTSDYLELEVDSELKAEMLIFRHYLDENDNIIKEITKDNYKSIVGKTIKLRSPIFCKSEKICKKCYGNLYKTLNSDYIGIIAAHSLSEVTLQLVLRTFHLSGVAKIDSNNKEETKQKDIISDLSNAARLLHKFENKNIDELLKDLFLVYTSSKKIHHVHFESIVAQLMWVGNNKWRLLKDRENHKYKFISVQSIASIESWLLGLCFSRPKQHILKGLLTEGNYSGIYEDIVFNK